MKKVTILIVLVLALVACSSDDDGEGKEGKFTSHSCNCTPANDIDLKTLEPAGFRADKEISSDDFFNLVQKCGVTSVKPGTAIVENGRTYWKQGSASLVTDQIRQIKVESVTPGVVAFIKENDYVVHGYAGPVMDNKRFECQQIINDKGGGRTSTTTECNGDSKTRPEYIAHLKSLGFSDEPCALTYKRSDDLKLAHYALGRYTAPSGETVHAMIEKFKAFGTRKCPGKPSEPLTVVGMRIVTAERQALHNCATPIDFIVKESASERLETTVFTASPNR